MYQIASVSRRARTRWPWALARDRVGSSGRRSVYGARKTWKELKRRGVEAGRDTVARVSGPAASCSTTATHASSSRGAGDGERRPATR